MSPDDFRAWRQRLGWTQVQAATKLGLSDRAIKHYEGGTRSIPPVVEKLCHAVARGNKPNSTHEFYDPRDIVATPREFFDRLDAEFHFDIDVCAVANNAKCKRYFTPEMNGLAQSWHGLTCFMNPPYCQGRTRVWIRKAYEESRLGAVVVCLVQATPDTDWWADYVLRAAEIRFIRGRLKGFARSVVVVFRRGARTPKPSTMAASIPVRTRALAP